MANAETIHVTIERVAEPLRVALTTEIGPDDDGRTTAIVLTEGTSVVTIRAAELEQVADLVRRATGLFNAAGIGSDPDPAEWASRQRDHLARLAATGDPNARRDLDEFERDEE